MRFLDGRDDGPPDESVEDFYADQGLAEDARFYASDVDDDVGEFGHRPTHYRLSDASVVRLLIRVITRAHHWPAGGVGESHFHGVSFEGFEALGWNKAHHGMMMRRGLQVLAEGEHVHIVLAQIAHDFENLLVGFTEAQHQTGLSGNARMNCFEIF